MVLRGDLNPPSGAVKYWLVDAPVPEFQFVRAEPEGPSKQLVAEADPEVRDTRGEHLPQHSHRPVCGGRVARTIGEENPIGFQRGDLLETRRRGQDVHIHATACHLRRCHALDTEVHGRHREASLPHRGNDSSCGRGYFTAQVGARHHRLLQHLGAKPVRFQLAGRDPYPHRPQRADVAGQSPGVDIADPDDSLVREFCVKTSAASPVRRSGRWVAHHVSCYLDPGRLVILVVPARVPDVRSGGQYHLAPVGGVGQGFLVAGHAGSEDQFPEGLPLCSKGSPEE